MAMLLGKKVGMTRVYDESGRLIRADPPHPCRSVSGCSWVVRDLLGQMISCILNAKAYNLQPGVWLFVIPIRDQNVTSSTRVTSLPRAGETPARHILNANRYENDIRTG